MDSSYIKNLKTPIVVIGLGKSGKSALSLLTEFGFNDQQLFTYDEKDLSANFHKPEQILATGPKTIVVSPGVPLKTDWIQKLIASGAELTSEISLAASLLTTEKVIGVTGSVGKSTVVSLLGVGARTIDSHAFVGGNLGVPFCNYALDLVKGKNRADWVVLELSSYQLENCKKLSLDYSIITFLSPNHMERYADLEEYYQTKLTITSITKNICLFNKTSADCASYARQSKCNHILINSENFSHTELLPQVYLIGLHNKDNFALASEIAHICKWPEKAFSEMTRYRGLAHRLEFVATLTGVTYVNDSKATAMDSVLVATRGCLENISDGNKVYLLLGGKDKNLPWEQLQPLSLNEKIIPVFFGACGNLAKQKANLSGEYFEKLGSAINYCQKRAQSGDVVLLSPGGTSLDEFKNFEERGDFFKTLVLSSVEA
ncbi:UDP-N-acetylmuramoyl-L-alanine--D-glutamate ligase [bacterium]|nr:UDP-N-acetylmuramoyl-L-alanine--D-glutamate ligase [bacterium]